MGAPLVAAVVPSVVVAAQLVVAVVQLVGVATSLVLMSKIMIMNWTMLNTSNMFLHYWIKFCNHFN